MYNEYIGMINNAVIYFIYGDKPCSLLSFQSSLPSNQKRRERRQQGKNGAK